MAVIGNTVRIFLCLVSIATAPVIAESVVLPEGTYSIDEKCVRFDPNDGVLKERVRGIYAQVAVEGNTVSMLIPGFRDALFVGEVVRSEDEDGRGQVSLAMCQSGNGLRNDTWVWTGQFAAKGLAGGKQKASLRGLALEFYDRDTLGGAICKLKGRLRWSHEVEFVRCP